MREKDKKEEEVKDRIRRGGGEKEDRTSTLFLFPNSIIPAIIITLITCPNQTLN